MVLLLKFVMLDRKLQFIEILYNIFNHGEHKVYGFLYQNIQNIKISPLAG